MQAGLVVSRSHSFSAPSLAMVLSRFVGDGHQTLAFTRSRKGAELVASYARSSLVQHGANDAASSPAVAAYRAGYLASERR